MAVNKIPKQGRILQSLDEERRDADIYETAKLGTPTPRCPACGQAENILWVHGHGQCTYCHTNILPCCNGETCS